VPQGLVVRFGLGLKSNQTKSGPVVATAASSLLLLHCIIIASATAAAEKVWAVLAARGTVIVVIVGRGSPPAARTPPRRRRPHDEVAGSPWWQGWGVGVGGVAGSESVAWADALELSAALPLREAVSGVDLPEQRHIDG